MLLFADTAVSADVTEGWYGCQAMVASTFTRKRGMESALGARTTGHANLARSHYEERTTLKRFSVFLEDGIEVFDFRLQGCSGKPKENDAGVGELLVEDQLTEIAVGNHQYPLLLPGNG